MEVFRSLEERICQHVLLILPLFLGTSYAFLVCFLVDLIFAQNWTKAISELPFTSVSKRIPAQNLSCENEFYSQVHFNANTFSYEWFSTGLVLKQRRKVTWRMASDSKPVAGSAIVLRLNRSICFSPFTFSNWVFEISHFAFYSP